MRALIILFFAFLVVTVQSAPCTEEDYIGTYTECKGGLKNLIYYKNPTSTCEGYDNKPENKFEIPCDISCEPGEYLPLGSTSSDDCRPCEAGEYSFGGGVFIDDWNSQTSWENFHRFDNLNFKSYCTRTYSSVPSDPEYCAGWNMIDGSYASSGDTDDGYISHLDLTVTFVRDGTVGFEYRVDAEANYDFFYFKIDNTFKTANISSQHDYIKVEFPVTKGVHTLTWGYYKDYSVSKGEDSAFLKNIYVIGTSWADSSCVQCRPGSFSANEGSASCTLCPVDTKNDEYGADECMACEVDEYAFPGSLECIKKVPCVESDVYSLYTACTPKGNGVSKRSKLFYWLEPHICDENASGSYRKPADEIDIDCAPCNPGFYRNDQGGCVSCAVNEYSEGGSSACIPCEEGEVGRRDFVWTNFYELPPESIEAKMDCLGDCGTQGWRLSSTGDFIDSGIGHGSYVDVQFVLPITVEGTGSTTFDFSFICSQGCYLTYLDLLITPNGKQTEVSRTYAYYTYGDTRTTITHPTKAGNHEFWWRFTKYDPNMTSRDSRVQIHNIKVTSVKEDQGGAESCSACPVGTFASPEKAFCQPCDYGTHNNVEKATQCALCPVNEYSDELGAVECKKCGDGTSSTEGATECSTDCLFIPNLEIGYDFTPLIRADMHGPFIDESLRQFYLSVCMKPLIESPCLDIRGDVIPTTTCVIEPDENEAIDTGHVLNFYEFEDKSRGAHIVYKDGSECPSGGKRSTNITLICSPDAGVGSPHMADPFETEDCVYHFEWPSLYGCPVCLQNDYTFHYTQCEQGKQTKVYSWKENPKRCHGGVALPENEIVDCVAGDTKSCPEGQFLLDDCEDCLPGTYSLGGSHVITQWNTLPKGFKTDCQGFHCAKWTTHKEYVEGFANSWLEYNFHLAKNGRLLFDFEGSLGEDVVLNIEVNQEVQQTIQKLTLNHETISIPLSEGIQTVRWHIVSKQQNAPLTESAYVRIFRVATSGSRLSDNVCMDVPPGTYQPQEGQNEYIPCKINEVSEGGRSDCMACAEDEYAPPGSTQCFKRPTCTQRDYSVVFTDCINGETTQTFTAKEPKICVGGYTPPLVPSVVPCECPRGTYKNASGECAMCPPGQFYDTQLKRCRATDLGKASVNVISFFEGQFQRDYMLTTGCTGSCIRSWTLTDKGMDSGLQYGLANSFIEIPVTITGTEGYMFLEYDLTGDNKFQIYVDGVLEVEIVDDKKKWRDESESMDMNMKENLKQWRLNQGDVADDDPLILTMQGGTHNIVLNYVNMDAGGGYVKIDELGFIATSYGGPESFNCLDGYYSNSTGSTTCTACPPGTYSNESKTGGNVACTPCPSGTYAMDYGTAKCSPCGARSVSSQSHQYCLSTCIYRESNHTINLLALQDMNLVIDHISGVQFEVNMCEPLVESSCVNANGDPLKTYVCALFGEDRVGIDFGENPNIVFIENGLQVTFTNGDVCDEAGTRRKTVFNLECNGSPQSEFMGVPKLSDKSSSCEAIFHWVTPAACKACVDEDYIPVPGKCVSREREVTFKLNSTDCYANKYSLPPPKTEICNEVAFPLIAIIALVLVAIILVIVIGFFYFKNRRLKVEYRLLKDARVDQLDSDIDHGGIELEDVNDDL